MHLDHVADVHPVREAHPSGVDGAAGGPPQLVAQRWAAPLARLSIWKTYSAYSIVSLSASSRTRNSTRAAATRNGTIRW